MHMQKFNLPNLVGMRFYTDTCHVEELQPNNRDVNVRFLFENLKRKINFEYKWFINIVNENLFIFLYKGIQIYLIKSRYIFI